MRAEKPTPKYAEMIAGLTTGAETQPVTELGEVDGFHKILVESGRLGFGEILAPSVTAHRNEECSFQARHGADAAGHFQAVHSGEANVEQNDLREKLGSHCDALGPGKSAARLMPMTALQESQSAGGEPVQATRPTESARAPAL